jgi:hypothetical protein
VVYITLELADKFVGRRMLQNLFRVKTRDDAEVRYPRFVVDERGKLVDIEEVEKEVDSIASSDAVAALASRVDELHLEGRLLIKSFPTGTLTVGQLDAYLQELETFCGFVPDLVILDYADLMFVDPNNYRLALGILYKELRGIAVERHLALVTASQVNRGGANAKLIRDSDVAEDFSKIAIADCVLTYNQTALERRRGLARLFVSNGRVEADRFSVLLSQSYTAGQFALSSFPMPDNYWQFVEEGDGGEDPPRESA